MFMFANSGVYEPARPDMPFLNHVHDKRGVTKPFVSVKKMLFHLEKHDSHILEVFERSVSWNGR